MFDYRLQLESRAIFRLPALQAGVMGDNTQPGRGRESSQAEWISDHAGETGRFPSAIQLTRLETRCYVRPSRRFDFVRS
jgi:hypothetical protein